MDMGFAKLSNCEFSDAIGCSYENSGKWLIFDEGAVRGSNCCKSDHCGKDKDVKKMLAQKLERCA